MQNSQRDQRASQRSIKNTRESSQNSPRTLKLPPRLSPKKVPKARKSSLICDETDLARSMRSSAPTERTVNTDVHALRPSELQNALDTATDKLGISDMLVNPQPPAMHDSSAPPTSLDAATTASSPLSSLDDSTIGLNQEDVPIITSGDISIYSAEPRSTVCPMCKQPVDQSYLEGFTKAGTRMSLRQQAQFCKAHKERSTESEWVERGYPRIDWELLDARIAKSHASLDDILSRRRLSFYRNAFEDSLKGGKIRTIQESMMGGETEGMTPGYYGGRGAKVMYGAIFLRSPT